jgi:hypothetical protein
MPIRFIDKRSVGEKSEQTRDAPLAALPTGATETVALPGTQKLSVNRMGAVLDKN